MLPIAVEQQQHVVVAPAGAQETYGPIKNFPGTVDDMLLVPYASSPTAWHSMRKDVHAEDEDPADRLRDTPVRSHNDVTCCFYCIPANRVPPQTKPSCMAGSTARGCPLPQLHVPPPRGGRINNCSSLKRFDKRVRDDRDARVATQLQPNHEIFEFWPLRPCSL
jgi:hypothetical protein